ncbi:MAG: hypothetical protein ABIO65_02540, partial [Nitrospiria bacterium]
IVTSTGVYRSPDQGRTWSAWNEGDDFTESQQFQDLVIVTGTGPETFLLASKRGVFTRRAGDAAWTVASPDLEGRRISALARHPNGREVFAAVVRDGTTLEGGGLYVSRDTGATWRPLARGLAGDWIRVIRVHPRDARIVYVATSGRGVLRSADGGRTWTPMNEGLSERDIRALVFDPIDPARLYAGTHGGGVFVSADGGRRWAGLDHVPDTTPDEIIAALKAPDPSRPLPDLRPPASFAKCNGCHGWTDPSLNQTAHSLWLMPANRRDWGRTVRRMSGPAKLTIDEQTEIIDFLTGYSNGGVRR